MSAKSSTKDPSKEELGLATLSRKLVYQRQAPPAALAKDLDTLPEFDSSAERRMLVWLIAGLLCFFAIGIEIFLHRATGLSKSYALIPAILLVFCIVKFLEWSRKNLDNVRYLLASRLLELFERDLNPAANLTMRLDFHKTNSKKNKLRVSDRTIYRSDWLFISGEYADGTRFSLCVSEIKQVKVFNGKVKLKGYPANLTLAFSKRAYKGLSIDAAASRKLIKVLDNVRIKSVKAKGNVLRISAMLQFNSIHHNPEPLADSLAKMVKMLLLSSYEILRSGLSKSG